MWLPHGNRKALVKIKQKSIFQYLTSWRNGTWPFLCRYFPLSMFPGVNPIKTYWILSNRTKMTFLTFLGLHKKRYLLQISSFTIGKITENIVLFFSIMSSISFKDNWLAIQSRWCPTSQLLIICHIYCSVCEPLSKCSPSINYN